MSRKNKYSTEDKLRAASLTNSGMTAKQVADVLRVEVPVATYLSYCGRIMTNTLKDKRAYSPRPAGKKPHGQKHSWATVPVSGGTLTNSESFVEQNVEPVPEKGYFWSFFWWFALVAVLGYSFFNSSIIW